MFRKSKPSTAPNLFEGYSQQLGGRKLKKYEDQNSWHNVFYKEITSKIDEQPFEVLYSNQMGRPSKSIRILLAMLILKEGNDWTDEQLFEACNFNILVGCALGLSNLSDQVPSPATYYNFKAKLVTHHQTTGIHLLEEVFYNLTKSQILTYQVSGKNIRMDSKLLQSNIAKVTRLQLSIQVLTKFYKSLSIEERSYLVPSTQVRLEDLIKKTASEHTYRLNKKSAKAQLIAFGELIYQLVMLYKNISMNGASQKNYDLLNQLWTDHFELIEHSNDSDDSDATNIVDKSSQVVPKNMKNEGGTNLQSAYDTEASYRNKPGSKPQVIRGFVTNITETCNEDTNNEANNEVENQQKPLQLITAVHTATATTSDDKFFQPAIEASRTVLDDPIGNVLTDGAYNSPSNEAFTHQNTHQNQGRAAFNWFLTAIQGVQGFYTFEKIQQIDDETNEVYKVTDTRTGLSQITVKTPTGKFRITEHHAKAKYRYFSAKTINNYFRRKEIEKYPKWVKGARANTEATIRQVFCKLDGMKTKYRGLFKHHSYVLARAIWCNYRRINAFLSQFLFIFLYKAPYILLSTFFSKKINF